MHLKTLSCGSGNRVHLMCRLRVKIKGHLPQRYRVTEPAMTTGNALLCLASFTTDCHLLTHLASSPNRNITSDDKAPVTTSSVLIGLQLINEQPERQHKMAFWGVVAKATTPIWFNTERKGYVKVIKGLSSSGGLCATQSIVHCLEI